MPCMLVSVGNDSPDQDARVFNHENNTHRGCPGSISCGARAFVAPEFVPAVTVIVTLTTTPLYVVSKISVDRGFVELCFEEIDSGVGLGVADGPGEEDRIDGERIVVVVLDVEDDEVLSDEEENVDVEDVFDAEEEVLTGARGAESIVEVWFEVLVDPAVVEAVELGFSEERVTPLLSVEAVDFVEVLPKGSVASPSPELGAGISGIADNVNIGGRNTLSDMSGVEVRT